MSVNVSILTRVFLQPLLHAGRSTRVSVSRSLFSLRAMAIRQLYRSQLFLRWGNCVWSLDILCADATLFVRTLPLTLNLTSTRTHRFIIHSPWLHSLKRVGFPSRGRATNRSLKTEESAHRHHKNNMPHTRAHIITFEAPLFQNIQILTEKKTSPNSSSESNKSSLCARC